MKKWFRRFFEVESASSIILFLATFAALWAANSPFSLLYLRLTDAYLPLINEGLMALFFLLIGLELKRGFVEGHLRTAAQIGLPFFAALGGMIVPALIYALWNRQDAVLLRGWATPVATDIAFALGVLSLFGKRVPSELKLFLLALAIFDDLGAIIIIALFYSGALHFAYLFAAVLLILALLAFNVLGVRRLWLYLLMGVGLWFCMLHAGIHPTIAGVILGLFIPHDRDKTKSPLAIVEHTINPWVAFFIMPLFAFTNAGFSFGGLTREMATSSLVLGIVTGLFFGKQLGVFGFSWAFIKWQGVWVLKETSRMALYGVSLLCGIGFTMSLFLGTLSFHQESLYLTEVRFGVMMGSLLSAIMGATVLFFAFARKNAA